MLINLFAKLVATNEGNYRILGVWKSKDELAFSSMTNNFTFASPKNEL